VKLGIDAVQILKLVKGGERSADDYGFGKHEGADAIESDDEDGDTPVSNDSPANVAADDDEDF
jgi:hypothetical protein